MNHYEQNSGFANCAFHGVVYFFESIYLCAWSTCAMGMGSSLASTGDCFFYFSVKKYEKQ
jgi:hypothetical protein